MTAKDKHKLKLLEFIGDAENVFPNRKDFPEILGVTKTTIYKHFTPAEMSEIEKEGSELRYQNSAKNVSNVLDSMYKRANGYEFTTKTVSKIVAGKEVIEKTTRYLPPDKPSAELYLDRIIGKVLEKKEIKVEGKDLAPILNVTLSKA